MIVIAPCKKSDYNDLIQIEKSTFHDNSSKNQLEILENQTSQVIWKIEKKKL